MLYDFTLTKANKCFNKIEMLFKLASFFFFFFDRSQNSLKKLMYVRTINENVLYSTIKESLSNQYCTVSVNTMFLHTSTLYFLCILIDNQIIRT